MREDNREYFCRTTSKQFNLSLRSWVYSLAQLQKVKKGICANAAFASQSSSKSKSFIVLFTWALKCYLTDIVFPLRAKSVSQAED